MEWGGGDGRRWERDGGGVDGEEGVWIVEERGRGGKARGRGGKARERG